MLCHIAATVTSWRQNSSSNMELLLEAKYSQNLFCLYQSTKRQNSPKIDTSYIFAVMSMFGRPTESALSLFIGLPMVGLLAKLIFCPFLNLTILQGQVLWTYSKSKLELKSNLSKILTINCKFICDFRFYPN